MKETLSKATIIYSISLLLIYYSSATFATPHSNDYISPRAESPSNLPEPPFNLTLNNQFTKEHNDTNVPSYAPENITCPSGNNVTFIRPSTSGIDPQEKEYISSRSSSLTSPQLRSFTRSVLISSNSTNQSSAIAATDLDRIFGNETLRPKTAMAFSGGGFRAMLNGAGVFKALDNRTSTVPEFAGLLQGMDYMAGLSGGNWLVGSTALNNFASVDKLRRDNWRLENGVITGVKGDPRDHLDDVIQYLGGIKSQVMQKSRAGFNVTLTDYWSLALGRQLIDEKGGGANITWSSIQDMDSFKNKSMPYPISISVGRKPGEKVVERNSTVYESTPYRFGSWDREVGYFFPMKYLGTRMQNGKPQDEKKCVRGFDSGPFVMGTSSSLFSGISSRIDRKKLLKDRRKTTIREGNIKRDRKLWDKFRIPGERLLVDVLERTDRGNFEFAEYPNPFQGYSPSNSSSSNSNKTTDSPPNLTKNYPTLYLADGGLDNQNIPLWPLLQPAREIDFIFAVDSSADTPQHWPNGSSLVSTQKRVKNLLNKQKPGDVGVVPFPYVPEDTRTWVDQGLNSRPVFFGCNGGNYSAVATDGKENNSTAGNKASNSTQNQDRNLVGPLIVYLPNVPWAYYTNTSTFQLDYIPEEVDGFLSNGAEQISQSVSTNTTTKANTTTPFWKTCLSCAILQRSKERAKVAVGDTCQRCFEKYCWGGGYPETPLPQGQNNTNIRGGEVYDPARKDGSGKGWEEQYNFIRRERERQGVGRDN